MFKNNLCLYHTHKYTHAPSIKRTEEHRLRPACSYVTHCGRCLKIRSPVSSQLRFFFVRNIRDADNNTEFMTRASEINK